MQENELCITYTEGLWVVGRFLKKNGQMFLTQPRLFLMMQNSHGIMSPPGSPDIWKVREEDNCYPVSNQEIADLYTKQVSGISTIVDSKEANRVMSAGKKFQA